MTNDGTNRPATVPAVKKGHSTTVVVGTGLAGLAVGVAAAFAITGLFFTVRVESPTAPSPQLSSAPSVSYPPTASGGTTPPAPSVPTSTRFTPLPPPPEPPPLPTR